MRVIYNCVQTQHRVCFFFSSRRRHTRLTCDWSSDVCSSDLLVDQLKDVNNLRPLLDVFAWLEWVGGARVQEHRQMLHEALRRALDGLLSTTLAHQWDRLQTDYLVSGDLVDRLEQARAVLLGPD